MHWLALREAWWPLAIAVAWVLLRSKRVVEQLLDRHPRKPITFTTVATYAAALKAGGQHTTPKLENCEAAFRELLHPLETGEIEIAGTPFVRVSDREGSSRLEMGTQQTIFYTEISSLVPYNDQGDLCLIPRDWRAAHGSARTNLRGYRNVVVRSAALVGRFPEERTQLAHVSSDAVVSPENITVDTLNQAAPGADPSIGVSPLSGPPAPPGGLEVTGAYLRTRGEAAIHPPEQPQRPHLSARPKRDGASRAIRALYPDGVPDQATVPNANLCRRVGDWLKEQKLPGVSDPTILRAAERRK
jgi:hypothetical protein